MDVRVISIGTMAANPLWGERPGADPVRTGHATSTLIRANKRAILVDPSLPEPALLARLSERANVAARDITHVFLTSFNPELRRALPAFTHATWWIGNAEREHVGVAMIQQLKHLEDRGDAGSPLAQTLRADIGVLQRCQPAPDSLVTEGGERVDLFPLPGVTPGLCGLLIAGSRFTTLICGDAIPTLEHLEQGRVPPGAADVALAQQSFAEAVEVADLFILGRDNLVVNPTRRPF